MKDNSIDTSILVEDFKKYGSVRGNEIFMDGQKIGELKDKKDSIKQLSKEEVKSALGTIYGQIVEVLKEYLDLKEDYYHLIAIWIIGTYLHKNFNTYPYLFFNAMKGSGKTRTLKLIEALSYNGLMATSIRESVLFRLPQETTLILDEFEGLGKKENQPVREILNACYKKGTKIFRMKKVKVDGQEDYVADAFEPYKPICMANIWGMEEVLGDRSITLILEKSNRKDVTMLIEDFDENLQIKYIKNGFSSILVQLCSFWNVDRYTKRWNLWLKSYIKYITTQTTQTQHNTESTLEDQDFNLIFKKIYDEDIVGRDLELFLPLLLIANFIGEDVFNKILKVASDLNKEKRVDQMYESRDMMLYDFVAQYPEWSQFRSIKELVDHFKNFLQYDDRDDHWLTNKWFGKALKRLDLVLDKKRLPSGMFVRLNSPKAEEKITFLKGEK